jgi:uncharacterized damage-inducible protein DinB
MSGVPYSAMLGDRDAETVIAETPGRLAKVLDGLSDEQMNARPAPGKWCVREIVAHLADCEIAWSWRLRYSYGAEQPVMQPFDQDAWAKVYDAYSMAEAWGCFKALRAWNVAMIGALTESERRKVIQHPERGEETVWTIVEIMAGHDLHHLAGLEK